MVRDQAVQVRAEDLRALIAHRTINVVALEGEPTLVLELHLARSLPAPVAAHLDYEVSAARAAALPGIVMPTGVRIQADGIRFELDPLQPRALWLESFTEGLARAHTPLSPGAAAAIVLTLASLLSQLRGEHGWRAHGALHQRSILMSPGGAVALVGDGHPVVQTLLLAPAGPQACLAPELEPDSAPSPTADVFALAALYVQLLTGEQTPDVNAERLPDPRPSLVRFLGTALDPNPLQRPRDAVEFGALLRSELDDAGIALAGPAELDQLIRTFGAAADPQGNAVFLDPRTDAPPSTPRAHKEDALPAEGGIQSRPPDAPPPQTAAPTTDPWAGVLGSERGEPAAPEVPLSDEARALQAELRSPAGPQTTPDAPRLTLPSAEEPAARVRPTRTAAKPRVRLAAAPPSPMVAAPAPPASRVVLATVGAIAIGLGLMSVLLWTGPTEAPTDPLPEPPPTTTQTNPDAGARAQGVNRPRSWRFVDAGADPSPKTTPNVLLSVVSQPLGARVELDGEMIGKTPIVQRRKLKETEYTLRVSKNGYVPWSEIVRPDENGALSVSAVLIPIE